MKFVKLKLLKWFRLKSYPNVYSLQIKTIINAKFIFDAHSIVKKLAQLVEKPNYELYVD